MHTSVPNVHIDSFGLWNYCLTEEELLVFLMCTHARLGAGSPYMAAPDEMLQSIRTSLAVPGATRMGRGLRNLLGVKAQIYPRNSKKINATAVQET